MAHESQAKRQEDKKKKKEKLKKEEENPTCEVMRNTDTTLHHVLVSVLHVRGVMTRFFPKFRSGVQRLR